MSLIVVDDDSSDELATVSDHGERENVRNGASRGGKELKMDERSYDDAETIDADNSNDDEDKPLLNLMKHLINYNGKQNTKLTNNQLIGILKKEFDLDHANLDYISVDIYMNVLKKFLKDWPQWDEFDQVMHETRCMDDNEEVDKMLDLEYTALKNYLTTILKAAEPFAKEASQKLKRSKGIPDASKSVPGDVVLEINCSREQLNSLIFRKPHPEHKNSIFNINTSLPSKICLNNQSLQSMLNQYVNITINMPCFKYRREMIPNFRHTLVNKKLRQIKRAPALNTHLQTWKITKTQSEISKKDLKFVIEKIQRSNRYSFDQQVDVDTIFKTIMEDLNVLTPVQHLPNGRIELPCTHRYYMSKYPYVRYLCKDVDAESDKYDLQLEEKISPSIRFHVGRLNMVVSAVTTDINWLKLECSICQTKYHGVLGIEGLRTHFRDTHQNEPNWSCTHCDKQFVAAQLAAGRWHHRCVERTTKLFES